ncbi:MAG: DUF177 domain-containing protein [Acidobacteria bacterium]|nr:DUF177 domain-containing protein [Acidobacteriota bacterium]
MQLDLNRIREAETPFAKTFEPVTLAAADDPFRIAGPVELAMTVRKDDDLYHLVGQIRGALELVCSRCLEPFTFALDPSFDLRYLPQHLNLGAGSDDAAPDAQEDDEDDGAPDGGEVGGDDLNTAFYRDDQIDLVQLIREQTFLAMPMKPLHSDLCKGLCPSCGANLNETVCTCTTEWIDPRLAPLQMLKNLKRTEDDA